MESMKFGELERKVAEIDKFMEKIKGQPVELFLTIVYNNAILKAREIIPIEFFNDPNYREKDIPEDVLLHYNALFEAVKTYQKGTN